MEIAVEATKKGKSVKGSCQSRKTTIQASYTDDDLSVLIEELERTGKDAAYDATGDDTVEVTYVYDQTYANGELVIVFEVSIGGDGDVINTIEVSLDEDDIIDEAEIAAWFEEEVRNSFQ